MSDGIAIIGMACRYPDADSPSALWENVMARRRAFRRLPRVRMSLDDYVDADHAAPDRTYSSQAAMLRDWTFDRKRFRIGASICASADLTHWLALEVADAALRDATLADVSEGEREHVAVVIGNSLTGDQTRANSLRLRWPFVARILDAALRDDGVNEAHRQRLLARAESRYKAPFPPVDENTLAGCLSNTIAGRICNAFGFGGGGYTVDGACASSLLAIANACSLLETHDANVVVAGGVDLSLDPFELVGFAKTAALATDAMFVYDRRASGFLPGEGCGIVVLMRAADARASGRRVCATIGGWGISSDGYGGLTRPEAGGQAKALRRAYTRAEFGIDSVTLFEGHGTGTPVGDAVEVNTLLGELRAHGASAGASFIGSVKANIGHTKAAAGVAGLIKAVMAVTHGIVPPVTACEEPIEALIASSPPLTVAPEAMPWPTARPRRAAVSAFGFGGINTHVVLDAEAAPRRRLTARETMLAASPQDAEIFLFAGNNATELAARVGEVAGRADELSLAELGDLAVVIGRDALAGQFRAAIIAATPRELAANARAVLDRIAAARPFFGERVAFASVKRTPRIGFLFPGQGSPVLRGGGVWQRRFPSLRIAELWNDARFAGAAREGGTALAQPSIVVSSLAALRLLDHLGIAACAAVGHSLGELTALCWAGAMDEKSLVDLAFLRGLAMQSLSGGRMAALACSAEAAERWLDGSGASIAGVNSPRQCVVSGSAAAIDDAIARARRESVAATVLPVTAAFHSPAMATAAPSLLDALRDRAPTRLARRVISTVTGRALPEAIDVAEFATEQLTAPVLFCEAVQRLASEVDLLIEAGPGNVLTGIASSFVSIPVVAIDACSDSLAGLFAGVAAAFAGGAEIDRGFLFADRFARPIDLSRAPTFIESPCENGRAAEPEKTGEARIVGEDDPEGLLREVIAARVQLPVDVVTPDSLLLRDLHLNSITVAHLVGEVAQRLGLPPLTAPTQFAGATIAEVARALGDLLRTGGTAPAVVEMPAGIGEWVRTFAIEHIAEALQNTGAPPRNHIVVSLIGCDAAASFARLREAAARLRDGETLVVVQERPRGGGFARTLHLERPEVNVCVINTGVVDDALIAAEAANTDGFREVFYERNGRFVPRLAPVNVGMADSLHPWDVLLVSGGGKGVAAESALYLTRRSGTAVAIIGRSDPAADEELATNLARFRGEGIRTHYVRADVTDLEAVARAIAEIRGVFGRVTAIVHGAGTNAPALIADLDETRFRAAFAPKVNGLHNLLGCCDSEALRLVIAFGSVIARTGMRGEAHYAFANEWLAAAMNDFGAAHPRCRTLTIEWSVWSGVGMGERLGRVEALRRDGITPIGVDAAVTILESLVSSDTCGSIVVAGRLGAVPTLTMREPQIPVLRFLEQPRVAIDGIEIIADAELTAASDPYLREHVFRGDALVPAVVGLETMAQAASALRPLSLPLVFKNVELRFPIVVGDGGTMIRVAALAHDDKSVETVIRSSATRFSVDHFSARLAGSAGGETRRLTVPVAPIPLDIERDIYDSLLFHRGRFRRIRSYRLLTARDCVAEIAARQDHWFALYRPAPLLLGDPGVRDAAVHALQACVPQATVLPAAVESIELLAPLPEEGSLFVHAHERERAADHFVYDFALTDAAGSIVERWRGLRLQVIERRAAAPDLVPILWAPLLERRLGELVEAPVRVSMNDLSSRPRECGPKLRVLHRPDGKPDTPDGHGSVSTAHAAGLTLMISSPNGVACDLELVVERGDDEWMMLLGAGLLPLARTIAAQTGEDFATSAVRIWTAHECTQKRHGIAARSFTLLRTDAGGVVMLSSGADHITTFVLGDGVGRRFVCGFVIDPQITVASYEKRRTP